MIRLAAALLLAWAVLAVGCSAWEPVPQGSRHDGPGQSYAVELPAGWLRSRGKSDLVRLTRDGFALEEIVIMRNPQKKPFVRLKKPVTADMLPSELAELQLADFERESETLAAARVIAMAPAQVGGRSGFRLHIAWTNDDGLPLGRVVYGVCDKDHYYMLGFEAPHLHYFDKHLPAFEAMVASFRLAAPP